MFFPERMKRIRLLAHDSCKQAVVKKLHELGTVQISDYREKLSDAEWSGLLGAHAMSGDVRRVTTQLMGVNRLLDVFSMVAPETEESFFKTLFAPDPPEKIKVEDLSGEPLFDEVAKTVSAVEGEIAAALAALEKADLEKGELESQRLALGRIQSLDVRLGDLGPGSFVHSFLGIAPKKDFSQLQADIDTAAGGMAVFETRDVSDTESCVLAVCLAEAGDDVAALLRKGDVERIVPGRFAGTPAQAIAEIAGRLQELDRQQAESRSTISKAAGSYRKRLKALRELLLIERERAEIYSNFARTDQVIAVEGWITAKKARSAAADIEAAFGGLAVVHITEPDAPEESLPVALDNPGILKHFELLVKLYAPPKYNEIDPTVLIFPTFLFFFGLMITDAMYGLMTLLLGVFILRGGGKYYPLYRSCGLLLTLGGISTVFLGAMTGGWFGNLGVKYLGLTFLDKLVVINPMVDVSDFLLFAIGVGVLHLNAGAVVNIIKEKRRGNIPATLKHLWIFFLEIALVFYYCEARTPALVFAGISGLFLLYAEKGMFLFGVTGLLGDSLSYARLMALGLVSFGLAVAINALARMVWDVSYVGWLLAIAILVGGHIFSFVLNLMGAFAHGIRLHFVEFFGKFYDGGGDDFMPFSIKRQLTEQK